MYMLKKCYIYIYQSLKHIISRLTAYFQRFYCAGKSFKYFIQNMRRFRKVAMFKLYFSNISLFLE